MRPGQGFNLYGFINQVAMSFVVQTGTLLARKVGAIKNTVRTTSVNWACPQQTLLIGDPMDLGL